MTQINTYLMHRPGRCIEVQWRDPTTRKLKTRSTGCTTDKEAIKFQLALEAELNAREGAAGSLTEFEYATERYKNEVMVTRAEKTQGNWNATKNKVLLIIDPKYVNGIKDTQIGDFTAALYKQSLAALTVKRHLSYLRTFLKWCKRKRMILTVPDFDLPKRVNKMKGRPITTEEFERMLAVVPDLFPAELVPGWRFLLNLLWYSGMRLNEALTITWNRSDFCINLDAGVVRLKIEANAQKSTKAELCPVAPDFSEWLLAEVPPKARRGRVVKASLYLDGTPLRLDTASNKIQEIGELAGVIVEEKPGRLRKLKSGKTKRGPKRVKFASAHDFRRSFGKRWRRKVKSDVLKALMRHASITTTEQFYDDETAEEVEAAIQANLGPTPNKSPNNGHFADSENRAKAS